MDYIKGLPLAPHRCRSAPHQLPLATAVCTFGVDWFKSHGQWMEGSETPEPGMIIFFDWDERGSSVEQDGSADHTGIVERVEDGIVYTVEGNSSDGCRERQYAVGHYEILGYGIS